MRNIVAGFASSPCPIVWPVHPRTRSRLRDLAVPLPAPVMAIAPVGYLDMVMLEKHARLIATDSGGVQKEAFFHRVPCLTLREETEWVELVEAGWNALVPPLDARTIAQAFSTTAFARADVNPYGDGRAGMAIATSLARRMS